MPKKNNEDCRHTVVFLSAPLRKVTSLTDGFFVLALGLYSRLAGLIATGWLFSGLQSRWRTSTLGSDVLVDEQFASSVSVLGIELCWSSCKCLGFCLWCWSWSNCSSKPPCLEFWKIQRISLSATASVISEKLSLHFLISSSSGSVFKKQSWPQK